MRKVSIDELIHLERNLQIPRADTYLLSYPEFVRFFQELDVIDRHHLIIGANLVYGWMPTVLKFKSHNFEEVARLVNSVKRGRRLHKGELLIIQRLINNSTVGTSKLLHFTNPCLYPIWDRRICRYLGGKAHAIDRVENYLGYVQTCEELIQGECFVPLQRSLEGKLGYEISRFRAVELLMFYGDKNG